jgi:sugar/nucleoside kinase (ribokinase family)
LVADLVVPIQKLPIRAQEHQPARDIVLEAGGTGNSLILAARLGLRTKALGTVGDDYYGRQVLEMLAAEGVDVDSVVTPPGSCTTTSIVLVDDAAQHVFVGRHGTGPQQDYDPAWATFIRQSGAIFLAGYAMHPDSTFSPTGIMTCFGVAHKHQVPIFFDLGPAAFLINRADVEAVIDHATVFLATQAETAAWLGIEDPVAAAQHFLARNRASLAIIKLGAEGCLLATKGQHVYVPGFPVEVRDTAGAGDAFAAACVYGYLKGWSLVEIGILANAVGGASVAKLGTGTLLPRRQEVVDLLRKHGHSLLES